MLLGLGCIMVVSDLYLDTVRNGLAKNGDELDFHEGLVKDVLHDA